MSSLSDLFVSYKAVSEPTITVPKYNFSMPAQNIVIPTSIQEKVDNVKTRMESPAFKWSSSGTETTNYIPTQSQSSTSTTYPPVQQNTQSTSMPTQTTTNTQVGNTISDDMLHQLHKIEGAENWTANRFKEAGEKWVTGPLGMVYKYDVNGKVIGTWKEGEKCTPEFAIQNAKNHYAKMFRDWQENLKGLPDVTQDRLDALVAGSDGTTKSKNRLMKYVKEHWGDWDAIDKFLRTHSTTAYGNGKRMPGLVLRRQFEADWFKGIHRPISWYQKNRKQFGV